MVTLDLKKRGTDFSAFQIEHSRFWTSTVFFFLLSFQLMLDNLNKSSGPLKTLTETWLVHSVSREDLARILEPLLLTLLGTVERQNLDTQNPENAEIRSCHCHDFKPFLLPKIGMLKSGRILML